MECGLIPEKHKGYFAKAARLTGTQVGLTRGWICFEPLDLDLTAGITLAVGSAEKRRRGAGGEAEAAAAHRTSRGIAFPGSVRLGFGRGGRARDVEPI
jgi:hypothetical protein